MRAHTSLAFAALVATCGSTQRPLVYPHGVAHADCGPADGPAIRIVLSPREPPLDPYTLPDGPFVELLINDGVSRAVGRTFDVDARGRGGGRTGFARRCGAPDDCQTAVEGMIRITAHPTREGRTTLEGSIDLQFGARDSVAGRFVATWVTHRAMCG